MLKKSKRAPYHGRNILRWCDQKSCNIPVLAEVTCPNCGHETRKVDLAPPFDVRPAFEADIRLIKKIIDKENFIIVFDDAARVGELDTIRVVKRIFRKNSIPFSKFHVFGSKKQTCLLSPKYSFLGTN